MKTIHVEQNGNVYSCDIGISKEEWLELLKNAKMPDEYRDTLLRFYYMPDHRGTCTAVSNAIGGNPQSLNSYITKIGQFVQKELNRFQVERPNGKPCFWIIPMCEGIDLPKGGEGTFEWQLRHELAEAIREYLYWYLIERYKELRRKVPIDNEEWSEIYKWKLITVSKGKTPLDIVRDHEAHPSKSELGGFSNLIDAARDNKTLKHLVDNNPEGLQKALDMLTDETKSLNDRLADYKSAMVSLLPPSGFNSKANDERTASTILTCLNPEKYTIYKYEVYTLFCKYLGEEKKPAGQCYEHFLSMLKPLSVLAASDKELQQIVEPSLKGQLRSDLLLAQDVLWILLIEFPEAMGYIHSLLTSPKQRVWLWSKAFLSDFQDTLELGSSAKTIKDFTPYKSRNALRKAYQQDVGNGDLKIPDAYWSFINEVNVGDIVVVFEPKKGNGKQYHLLHGWGIITSDCTVNESHENPMSRTVQWRSFLEIPKQNEEMGNSVFFQGTTDKQALHIKELLDINSEAVMESKYQKYIDLLEANKNLILTGAPGTGKTFMAIELAKELITNIEHPKSPMDVLKIALNKYEQSPEVESLYSNLLKEFYAHFPKEQLKDMTLEKYCIGRGDENKDNFCFWMERRLKPLGYYFPGSSRSYLLYWKKSEEEYKVHGYLKNEPTQDPNELMKILAKDIYTLVINEKPQDYVGKFGESLILKILNSYYPDKYAPINSKVHIDHIISLFDIPCSSEDVFERNKAVFRFYKEQTKGLNISPFNFMEILYKNFNIKDGEMLEHGEIKSEGEYRFVQFHPSYDYTDFVEGLRPIKGEGKEIGFKREDGIFKELCSLAVRNPNKQYVMIIDEINRGEVSKIFGELFFSIDPGYRGSKVKVQTQYQNLITEEEEYQDGFYVPENVFIIGTMNDIDRSVESMDFAMRRRFAWKEVTAEESMQMLDGMLYTKEAKSRMKKLNEAILKMHGLGRAYQIGAAYFKKIEQYKGDFELLWQYHLEGLLSEYLRGNNHAEEQLSELKKAYNNESADTNSRQ